MASKGEVYPFNVTGLGALYFCCWRKWIERKIADLIKLAPPAMFARGVARGVAMGVARGVAHYRKSPT